MKNHGGARKNSGRPTICDSLKNRSQGFSMSPDDIQWLNAGCKMTGWSRSRLLAAIISHYRRGIYYQSDFTRGAQNATTQDEQKEKP